MYVNTHTYVQIFWTHTQKKKKTKRKVATKYGEKKRAGFFSFINIYMYISTDRHKKKNEYNIVLNKVNEQQKRRILFSQIISECFCF